PPVLIEVCKTALRARPDDRFATALEMREALEEYGWSSGGVPRARDIAQVISTEFALDRKRMHDLLDAALARLRSGENGRTEPLTPLEPQDKTLDSSRSAV